ncbi:hypothetical protein [Pedobacter aquatilis]|uniref:hypothetical protein n=1 Tax=Pedobacter aquatilis TaxID=351343 RepID=UPI00292F08C3|nr:hypothetical protein [Pedobacter aquatilis]
MEIPDDDFDYPTINDFFEYWGNCACNLVDEGDSTKEIKKRTETYGVKPIDFNSELGNPLSLNID